MQSVPEWKVECVEISQERCECSEKVCSWDGMSKILNKLEIVWDFIYMHSSHLLLR
jgi:hypothetical protein